jgi:hypothetical protein
MRKLVPVEEAKALMREANNWSLWSWLTEKRRLRLAADAAWDALEEVERRVKAGWSDDVQKAYACLYEKARADAKDPDPQLTLALQRVREAEDEGREARRIAEETFDEAERRMSTGMACQGTQQAIRAWELTERAIRRAESLARRATASEA